MFRSSETRMSVAGTPQCTSLSADRRIMISGPHTNAAVSAGSSTAFSMRPVTLFGLSMDYHVSCGSRMPTATS
jgi:hypothetical protein